MKRAFPTIHHLSPQHKNLPHTPMKIMEQKSTNSERLQLPPVAPQHQGLRRIGLVIQKALGKIFFDHPSFIPPTQKFAAHYCSENYKTSGIHFNRVETAHNNSSPFVTNLIQEVERRHTAFPSSSLPSHQFNSTGQRGHTTFPPPSTIDRN